MFNKIYLEYNDIQTDNITHITHFFLPLLASNPGRVIKIFRDKPIGGAQHTFDLEIFYNKNEQDGKGGRALLRLNGDVDADYVTIVNHNGVRWYTFFHTAGTFNIFPP